MTLEIEYRNPGPLSAGEWQVSMAEEAVANASTESPLSSITDVEREIVGGTLIVRVPEGESSATKTAIRNAIESHLPGAVHVETRQV